MQRERTFSRNEVFPSYWVNRIGDLLSTLASPNFTVQKLNATTIRVPAGADDQAVAISVQGDWRWSEVNVDRAHPGGAAGTYPAFITAAANDVVDAPEANTDDTNRAFALAIAAPGGTPGLVPGTVDIYRHVADVVWDGAQITAVDVLLGPWSGQARHAADHAQGGRDPITGNVALGAGSVLSYGGDTNLYRSGASVLRTDGYLDAGSGYRVAGVALASTHLVDSALLARLAGPAFSGVPTAPTAAQDTNTTQLATTAYVLGQASAVAPAMNGAAAVGSSLRYARADHVHSSATTSNVTAQSALAQQVTVGSVAGQAGVLFGSAGDANLYRTGAAALKTDGSLEAAGGVTVAGAPLAGRLAASALQVKDVGIAGQLRAGRVFVPGDFTTLLGANLPVAIYNLTDLTDASGNGRSLTNKGAVTFGGTGVAGQANVAIFHGGATDALYRSDVGGADQFRITTGSWGCWFKTAKRTTTQVLVAKVGAAAGQVSYQAYVSGNVLVGMVSVDGGTTGTQVSGTTDVCDDRWHFGVVTFDGTAIRLYLDGQLDASLAVTGVIAGTSAPLNIGANSADGATNAANPLFGRIDEAFVTDDVLSDDQIRLLYAAKLAHGSSVTPNVVTVNVRRRRKGAALVPADFPASPRRLYNFTAASLADAGLDGAALAANGGLILTAAGADGLGVTGAVNAGNAAQLASASSQYLSASDTGLPALATVPRVLGAWFKTLGPTTANLPMIIVVYGADGAATFLELAINSTGQISLTDGTSIVTGPNVLDGLWHFAVGVQDPNPTDGLKWKLYLDGKLVGSATSAIAPITLAGATGFRIGRDRGTGTSYFNGTVDGVFALDFAPTLEQINVLYNKASQPLPASPKNEGDHIEGIDAANLYIIGDTLEGQHTLDIRVAA